MVRRAIAALTVAATVLLGTIAGVGAEGTAPAAATAGGVADLNLMVVFDGLRPDAVDPDVTPNLYELAQRGVTFEHANAVFHTGTRVNAASVATATFPNAHGIVGSTMYVPEVNPGGAFTTGDANNLIALGEATGAVVLTETAAERLERRDKLFVSVGSGTSGTSYLLNPAAAAGAGVMINVGDPTLQTPLAIPASIADEILARFGPPPAKAGAPNHNASVDYATQVFTDYVLPDLEPDVAYVWLTEPDTSQHARGAGSPEGLAAIHNSDRNLGLILDRLDELDLDANVFVTSDHGFSKLTFGVNLDNELIAAGLKAGPGSTDVVVAHHGSALIYVEGRNPHRIAELVAFFQQQEYADAIYTAAQRPAGGRYRPVRGPAGLERIADGWVEGTFSLELISNDSVERGPDIILTFPWTSAHNEFGVPGTTTTASTGPTGPINGGNGPPHSGHGSLSPWDVRIPLIVAGPDFKQGVSSPVPAANIDVTATILALEGVETSELAALDGRTLAEALVGGPDPQQVTFETRTFLRDGPAYQSVLQLSLAGGTRYVDKSWRVR